MKKVLYLLLKIVKFALLATFKVFKFLFFMAIYSDSQSHINTCNAITGKDQRDYKNRVGKYNNND